MRGPGISLTEAYRAHRALGKPAAVALRHARGGGFPNRADLAGPAAERVRAKRRARRILSEARSRRECVAAWVLR